MAELLHERVQRVARDGDAGLGEETQQLAGDVARLDRVQESVIYLVRDAGNFFQLLRVSVEDVPGLVPELAVDGGGLRFADPAFERDEIGDHFTFGRDARLFRVFDLELLLACLLVHGPVSDKLNGQVPHLWQIDPDGYEFLVRFSVPVFVTAPLILRVVIRRKGKGAGNIGQFPRHALTPLPGRVVGRSCVSMVFPPLFGGGPGSSGGRLFILMSSL